MMRTSNASRAAAFTLVELLIGAALSAAIMAAVLSSYVYLGRNLARLANQQTIESESRRALDYFAQDVQGASEITGTPSTGSVVLTVPTAKGATTITYYYNPIVAESSGQTDNVIVNGAIVKMWRQGLTRCVYDGVAVSSQTLVRNITDNNAATTADLYLRYFDAANNPYDNGTAPYTTVTSSSVKGIKQVSLSFSVQLGNAGSGTRTPVYTIGSGRLILRNRAILQ